MKKRIGFPLANCDAYVNVAGGIKVNEPSVDLGLVIAIVSSYKNISVPENLAVFGEVGLSGEVRSVSQADARVKEAKKLGFTKCILPASCRKTVKDVEGMELEFIDNVKNIRI